MVKFWIYFQSRVVGLVGRLDVGRKDSRMTLRMETS